MINKDTFWTIGYLREWIHGHYDRDRRCEVITTSVTGDRQFRSLAAAKRAVSARSAWVYMQQIVLPAEANSSGIRWYTRTIEGNLRADSKQSMRKLIRQYLEDL